MLPSTATTSTAGLSVLVEEICLDHARLRNKEVWDTFPTKGGDAGLVTILPGDDSEHLLSY